MMTLTDGIRLWFILIWSLANVSALVSALRFRDRRGEVEVQAGPLPAPMTVFYFIVLLVMLTRTGELGTANHPGELALRALGVGLSLYDFGLLPWTMQALGRFAVPGPAVLRAWVVS